jgi:hypothetical protein
VPEVVSSTDELGGNQDQTGPRSRTLVDDEAKPDVEKDLEKVTTKQNKTQGKATEVKIEVVATS